MLDPKIELLDKLPIFRGLTHKQLDSILSVASKAFFQPGECLITKDAAGHTAYLIMTGAATCLDFPCSPSQADRIGPGTLVGEMAMLVDTVHSMTVRADERLRAIAIHREALRRAMERDPAIAQQLADNLLVRLRDFAHDLRKFDRMLAKVEFIPIPDAALRPASHALSNSFPNSAELNRAVRR